MDYSVNDVCLGKYMKIFIPFTKIRIKCSKILNIRNTLQMLEESFCDHEIRKALKSAIKIKNHLKRIEGSLRYGKIKTSLWQKKIFKQIKKLSARLKHFKWIKKHSNIFIIQTREEEIEKWAKNMIRELKEKKIPDKHLGKMFNLIEMQVFKDNEIVLSTGLAEDFCFLFLIGVSSGGRYVEERIFS